MTMMSHELIRARTDKNLTEATKIEEMKKKVPKTHIRIYFEFNSKNQYGTIRNAD